MVLFLYGENNFATREYLHQVIDQFKQKVDPQGLNITIISGQDLTIDNWRSVTTDSNLLSPRRLIVIEDLLINRKIPDSLQELIKDTIKQQGGDEPHTNVLVFYESTLPDQRMALFKLLTAQPRAKQFTNPAPSQLLKWAQTYTKQLGATLSLPAANLLLANTSGSMWLLASELAKLASFKHGQTITAEDVKMQTSLQTEIKIFDLTDALGGHQLNRAMQFLHYLLSSDEEPLYILAMLSRQLRLLALAKEFSSQPPLVLTQKFKLPPFVANKLVNQSKLFSWERLCSAYQHIQQADLDLKNSNLPGNVILTKLVAVI